MTEQLTYLLIGLYFLGVCLPGLLVRPNPIPLGVKAQALFAAILLVLAFLHVALLR